MIGMSQFTPEKRLHRVKCESD